MTTVAGRVWDEASLVLRLSPEGRQAWESVSPGNKDGLLHWVLRPRWQRSRRGRCAEVDRLLRLGLVVSGAPTGLAPQRAIDYVLDPLTWSSGKG